MTVARHARPVACLGEALVDFVAAEPADELVEARAFVPCFGGSQANIAVGAARFGAAVTMVGGAGGDPWGCWLRDVMAAEDVHVSHFELADGLPTPHAFVALSSSGEPSFSFFAHTREALFAPAAERFAKDLPSLPPGVVSFGSDTLIGPRERQATLAAVARARDAGWTVVYDPNLRPARWPEREAMVAVSREAMGGVTLVKVNLAEARALGGAEDPARAGAVLLSLGAGAAVITMGGDGALVVCPGGALLHVPVAPTAVVDATGAGDAVAAVFVAAYAHCPEPPLHEVTSIAVQVAAHVVRSRGALAGLPHTGEARAMLAGALASG